MSTTQDRVKEFWNIAAVVGSFGEPGEEPIGARRAWEMVARRLLPSPPCNVLDLGCGRGNFSFILAEMGYAVTGVDAAASMIAAANASLQRSSVRKLRFAVGDATAPPLEAGAVDAIVLRQVLWTLADPGAALRAANGLLPPGGTLFVLDGLWFADGWTHGPPDSSWYGDSRRLYTEETVSALPLALTKTVTPWLETLRTAGFEIRSVTPLPELVEATEGEAREQATRYFALVAARV